MEAPERQSVCLCLSMLLIEQGAGTVYRGRLRELGLAGEWAARPSWPVCVTEDSLSNTAYSVYLEQGHEHLSQPPPPGHA